MLDPLLIPNTWVPRAPDYELSPEKQVFPGGGERQPPWIRWFQLIISTWFERQAGLCYWYLSNLPPGKIWYKDILM